MKDSSAQSVTELLLRWRQGDHAALDELMPIVYQELRRLARRYVGRERSGHTMQTSDLVHEAYLRLLDYTRVQWQDRSHFMAVAAQAMRRILVEHARAHRGAKRGGDQLRVTLTEAADIACEEASDVLKLDDALSSLAVLDPRKARIVELRYFGGLSVEETAEVLGISRATLIRDWQTTNLVSWDRLASVLIQIGESSQRKVSRAKKVFGLQKQVRFPKVGPFVRLNPTDGSPYAPS